MECYSTIKQNDIVLFAGEWMELKNIISSKASQVPKDQGLMFPLICGR
jgi:hypothetical protein